MLLILLAATPAPADSGLDPLSVSPGVFGFLATFAVVLVTVLLMIDLSRRVRRLRHGQERQRQAGRHRAAGRSAGE